MPMHPIRADKLQAAKPLTRHGKPLREVIVHVENDPEIHRINLPGRRPPHNASRNTIPWIGIPRVQH